MKLFMSIVMLSTLLFASKADFLHDYKEALVQAKAQKKDIYMLITSESCQWCRKFEKITLNDKTTVDLLKKDYVLLSLTRDVDYIPQQYIAKRVPKHYFLTTRGEIIYGILGYWNPEDFRSFIAEAEKKK